MWFSCVSLTLHEVLRHTVQGGEIKQGLLIRVLGHVRRTIALTEAI